MELVFYVSIFLVAASGWICIIGMPLIFVARLFNPSALPRASYFKLFKLFLFSLMIMVGSLVYLVAYKGW